MVNALSSLFEGRNINRKMTLRNQLKGLRAQKSETMQYYFTRIAQIKDQLESISDTVEKQRLSHDNLEWPSKILGSFHLRNMFKKKANKIPEFSGRMCPRRTENSSQKRKAK